MLIYKSITIHRNKSEFANLMLFLYRAFFLDTFLLPEEILLLILQQNAVLN